MSFRKLSSVYRSSMSISNKAVFPCFSPVSDLCFYLFKGTSLLHVLHLKDCGSDFEKKNGINDKHFSKVLEKIVYNHVFDFIDTYNLLSKQKFGFRKNHGTNHAVITAIDRISTALDS